ncbi:MAG: MarC family protein [Alphaproteobacteria bacterium]
MIAEAALTSFIAALFSMTNPIGNLGIFAGLTAGRPPMEARRIALTCAVATAVTLLVVAWAGTAVLAFFGIGVDALRTAGGLIVLLIGLHMLFNKAEHKHSEGELDDAKDRASIGVVPLAIPIVAGPGTMTAVLVAVQQHPSVLDRAEISAVILARSALVGALFCLGGPLSKRLGTAGMGVVTRVMGMILAAIAVGMLAEGLGALLPGLAGTAH